MLPSPSGDCVVETRERGGPALSRNHDDWFLFGFSESAHSLKCAAFFSTKTGARNKTPSGLKKTFIPLCPLFRVVSTSNDGCFVLQTPPPHPHFMAVPLQSPERKYSSAVLAIKIFKNEISAPCFKCFLHFPIYYD